MAPKVETTAFGIRLSFSPPTGKPLEPSADANQTEPRGHYVYAHLDSDGRIFYIGKGVGRRAWDKGRHHLWRRYVENHLGGTFEVRILVDNLSEHEVDLAEEDWVTQHAAQLVNSDNMAAPFDYPACERANQLRDANRALILTARPAEQRDLEEAVAIYAKAIEAIQHYAFVEARGGLVGQLLAEFHKEEGFVGEREALNRLSMCLVKLGRAEEAQRRVTDYFATYRGDLAYKTAEIIKKRIDKALKRCRATCP